MEDNVFFHTCIKHTTKNTLHTTKNLFTEITQYALKKLIFVEVLSSVAQLISSTTDNTEIDKLSISIQKIGSSV